MTEKWFCWATARFVSTFTSSKNSRTADIQVWDSTINFYKKIFQEKVHASASSKPSYAYTLRKDVICFCPQCLYSHLFRNTQTAHTNIHIKQNNVAFSMHNPVCWLRNVPIFISVRGKRNPALKKTLWKRPSIKHKGHVFTETVHSFQLNFYQILEQFCVQ